jgi:hypothetical protein
VSSVSSSLSGQINLTGLTYANVEVINLNLTLAATEYTQTFVAGTKGFDIQNRDFGLIKISFASLSTSTDYWTIFPGQARHFSIFDGTTFTLYAQSPLANQTLEMIRYY